MHLHNNGENIKFSNFNGLIAAIPWGNRHYKCLCKGQSQEWRSILSLITKWQGWHRMICAYLERGHEEEGDGKQKTEW